MAAPVPVVPARFRTAAPPRSCQRNTVQVHAGAEHAARVKSVRVPLRAGVFRDESMAIDSDGEVRHAWGFTVGAGVRWRQLALDGAWVRSLATNRYQRDTFRTSLRVELPEWRRP